ncbi:hypothetical protein ALC53_10415 [Atta colombica]|uniref:Uncharacterized protein n=1 Tax=Atta colombica TaxID=520822 RepID=A0A195B4Z2_9HYME|nr:hypothetical protein ALC53_10415 [Atta colombica]
MIEQVRARDLNDRNLNEYFVGAKGQSERGFSSTVVEEKWKRMMVVKKVGVEMEATDYEDETRKRQ